MGLLGRPSLRRPVARLPQGTRIYAIGDVHGCADLLDQVFSRIDSHVAAHPVRETTEVLLGDYIDRGPNSRGVIDSLIERTRSRRVVLLKGNHETFVPEFIRTPQILRSWRQMGGFETLLSYGLSPSLNASAQTATELAAALRTSLPRSHLLFLDTLRPSFTCGDFFFAHAGVKPGVPLSEQREEDLLWIRDEFLRCEEGFGKIVVHGHTPVADIEVRPNRINIDTGAYATGRLSCLVIQDEVFEPL